MKRKSINRSAFFNPRTLLGVFISFAGICLALFALSKASAEQGRTPNKQQAVTQTQYRGLIQAVHFDISPPLREMTVIAPGRGTHPENEDRDIIPRVKAIVQSAVDPVVQAWTGQRLPEISPPIISFNGPGNLSGVSPPDPNGAVGLNHVVAISNLSFQIFTKTGTSVFGPAANNTLWAGFGGGCQTRNDGDPVVLYDHLADRWLITQFTAGAPYLQCIALSQTGDPTGSYYRWSFPVGGGNNFGDYPKVGTWPDAYYFSTREFAGGSTFVGVGAYAFNRAQALVGNPNPQVISFLAPPNPAYVVGDGLLPSDLDGPMMPPAGSPNFYIGSEDNNGGYGAPQDALTVWKFHADFNTPANSFFTLTNTLPTAPFNSILALCGGGRACIPQPNTSNKIDHLGYRQRPMFRAAYRNFGDHEAIVTNQSVSAGTGPNGEVSGIRWWELRGLNTTPVIFQEGTYAPGLTDGIHRWMGSIALNAAGDMALGYSASNGTNPSVFPSVYYTARKAADPPGQMTLGEGSIINGTGSQTGSNRWGDYTSMVVDPVDDTTFWYVNQWVPTTSSVGWQLRIGAFRLGLAITTTTPACGSMVTGTPPTDFIINLSDPVNPATVQGSDLTVNGTPANSAALSNGNATITFHFNSSPVTTGLNTMHIAAGAFNRQSDGDPNPEFTCTFRYGATQLTVTTTVPPVGGTFSPPAPNTYNYVVNWNMNVDPTSVQTSDLQLTGTAGATVTGVSTSGSQTTFTIQSANGGTLTATIPTGAITDMFGNPNAAFSGNYTILGCPPADHYTITQTSCSIVPGTTDIGNHGDDQVTNVVLPFSYTLYDQTYTSVNLSSNGNAQFVTTDTNYLNSCLPWTTHNYTIFPYWDDLYLVNSGFGIFTSISGTAPNRIFNIEWRAQYYPGNTGANFELRLYEGQTRFDIIYGTVTNGNTSATAGVQRNDTAFDQLFCNGVGNPATGCYSFTLVPCNQVTVTGAVSRKTHGGAGTFDVALPLTGPDGVECRTGGATNDHTMVVTFATNVTVTGSPQAQLTMGTGCVGSGGVCTGNVNVSGNTVTVPLTNITNAQNIIVQINGVNAAGADTPATDVTIPMGVLAGDTNANRTVNAADVAQTKGRLGQGVDGTNFRSDVNANGSINAGDVAIVKQNSGTSIP